MAQPSFLPLLASLWILFPLAAPSDLPPAAPNISVTPPKARFLIGDAISILCAAPAPPAADRIQGFRFTGTAGWVTDVRSSRRSSSHTFNVTGPRDGGFHTCSYSVLRPGRGVLHSPASPAVFINVQDRPAQPSLSVTPSSVTVEGQPLVFFCTAPPGGSERRFRFFQEELEVAHGIPEGSGADGFRLRVERSEQKQTGNFSCRYEEMTEGRWIASYPSDAVQVVVEEPSPAPWLWVEPPSGVVAPGQRLVLSCAAPHRPFRRRFRFFRDGAEITPGDVIGDVISEVVGDRSDLLFPRVSPELGGKFSCRMEEEVGGAWLEAPPSRGVAVVVGGGFSPSLVIGVVVGVALLLLVILLAAWLCGRSRGGSR